MNDLAKTPSGCTDPTPKIMQLLKARLTIREPLLTLPADRRERLAILERIRGALRASPPAAAGQMAAAR